MQCLRRFDQLGQPIAQLVADLLPLRVRGIRHGDRLALGAVVIEGAVASGPLGGIEGLISAAYK